MSDRRGVGWQAKVQQGIVGASPTAERDAVRDITEKFWHFCSVKVPIKTRLARSQMESTSLFVPRVLLTCLPESQKPIIHNFPITDRERSQLDQQSSSQPSRTRCEGQRASSPVLLRPLVLYKFFGHQLETPPILPTSPSALAFCFRLGLSGLLRSWLVPRLLSSFKLQSALVRFLFF